MARIDRVRGKLTFAGVGNIAAHIYVRLAKARQHLVSVNGTAGHQMHRIQRVQLSLAGGWNAGVFIPTAFPPATGLESLSAAWRCAIPASSPACSIAISARPRRRHGGGGEGGVNELGPFLPSPIRQRTRYRGRPAAGPADRPAAGFRCTGSDAHFHRCFRDRPQRFQLRRRRDASNISIEGRTAPQLFIIKISGFRAGHSRSGHILEGRYKSPTGMGLGIHRRPASDGPIRDRFACRARVPRSG